MSSSPANSAGTSQTWSNALLRETPQPRRAAHVYPPLIPPAGPPRVSSGTTARARRLIHPVSADLDADADSEHTPLPQEPTSGFLSDGLQSDVQIHIDRRKRERDAQFRQLQLQLERLKERLAVPPPSVDTPNTVQIPPPEVPPTTQQESPTNVEPQGTQPPESDAADEVELDSDPTSASPPTIAPKPSSVFADSLAAQALVKGPVDRVGLADNLYALDELQIALEMYQQVDLKEVPVSERFWITYQTASCFRRLKKLPEAQETYRRLAGRSDAGWLAKMSTWWLHRMDARQELENTLNKQQKILDALTEVYDEQTVE
ncbi:hypothetical protein [Fuerstiella marisgermanici]|nr:hypothetical protein [Fuerstiella marisgermanici]